MTEDSIRINSDTGRPVEEKVFYVAVSDRVKEHVDDIDIPRAFGMLLEGSQAITDGNAEADEVVYFVAIAGVKVRFELREDGGWSMTLARDGEVEHG